jgi:hypothetical protein
MFQFPDILYFVEFTFDSGQKSNLFTDNWQSALAMRDYVLDNPGVDSDGLIKGYNMDSHFTPFILQLLDGTADKNEQWPDPELVIDPDTVIMGTR